MNKLDTDNQMLFFAGPCVIESYECLTTVVSKLKVLSEKFDLDFYFKASFDKANRTSIDSFRGPGIKDGLDMLSQIKKDYGVKIITDIHEPWQAEPVAEVVDAIQIPAYLCRQTDLLLAAAKTNKLINVKKGQFLAPDDMKNVVRKIESMGNRNILLCERGTTFGYHNLVVDMTSIIEMKKTGYPVIFDATHSVQKPGGNGISTGGNREYIEPLSLAAIAAGADGIFMETHPDPEYAKSDGTNMICLSEVEVLLEKILKLKKCMGEFK